MRTDNDFICRVGNLMHTTSPLLCHLFSLEIDPSNASKKYFSYKTAVQLSMFNELIAV